MATSRIFNWFDNAGSPSNLQNFQFNLGAVNKLYRVRVTGSVIYPTSTVTTSSEIVDPIIWGIQWGDAGFTPQTLPTDADSGLFLTVAAHTPGEVVGLWSPSTDTAGSIVGGPLEFGWDGQLYIGGVDIDIVVTVTYSFTSLLTWVSQGAVEAVFS